MMNVFVDTLKEGFSTDITTVKIVVTLLLVIVIGIYIFFVYKYKSKSSFYSRDFNNVLALLPVVTSGIVLAMQSSIVISLGMVGALSIVRFRNAVKNSMDLLFLFWSISVGIICGAGMYEIAILLSLFVTLLFFVLDIFKGKRESSLLVISAKDISVEEKIKVALEKFTTYYKVKSRSVSEKNIDLVVEVVCKNEIELIKKCNSFEVVCSVCLLSHDGEERM